MLVFSSVSHLCVVIVGNHAQRQSSDYTVVWLHMVGGNLRWHLVSTVETFVFDEV